MNFRFKNNLLKIMQNKNSNKIIIITGFSASGKDTLAKILNRKYGYNFVVLTTTRPIRDGESQRDPYNFIDKDEFINLISNNQLIEYKAYNTLYNNNPDTWYYGVELNEINDVDSYVLVRDIEALNGYKEKYGERVISFFIDADEKSRKLRCQIRGDFDETEWNRRLIDDNNKYPMNIIENTVNCIIDETNLDKIIDVMLNVIKIYS